LALSHHLAGSAAAGHSHAPLAASDTATHCWPDNAARRIHCAERESRSHRLGRGLWSITTSMRCLSSFPHCRGRASAQLLLQPPLRTCSSAQF